MNQKSNKLSVKDLVVTGVFTALMVVFALVGGMVFAANPAITFFMPAGSALLCGPIFLLLIAKVQKRWSLSIMGIIFCIIWFLTGMHPAFAIGYLLMSIVADLVSGIKGYKSRIFNLFAYVLFSLGATGSYLVFFINPERWAETMLGNGTEQNYIDTMRASGTASMCILMFVAVIVTAVISGGVGNLLLKKQFEKAGITA